MKRVLFTVGLGASLMYFFDPKEGNARREKLRESFESLFPKTNEALHHKVDEISAKAHNLADKADGAAADAIESAKLPSPSTGSESLPPEVGSA